MKFFSVVVVSMICAMPVLANESVNNQQDAGKARADSAVKSMTRTYRFNTAPRPYWKGDGNGGGQWVKGEDVVVGMPGASIDPHIVYPVDPNIDPGIVVHFDNRQWSRLPSGSSIDGDALRNFDIDSLLHNRLHLDSLHIELPDLRLKEFSIPDSVWRNFRPHIPKLH